MVQVTVKVNSEGLINYIIPKYWHVQASEDAINYPAPEPVREPKDVIIDVWIDDENDREYDHVMLNRKIRVFYDNRWYQGTIEWYNSKIDQYQVLYPDGTNDYVELDDIDGIMVILEDWKTRINSFFSLS